MAPDYDPGHVFENASPDRNNHNPKNKVPEPQFRYFLTFLQPGLFSLEARYHPDHTRHSSLHFLNLSGAKKNSQ